jgi:tRNA threonylcarbamoyladenosine biosynthesis protein TsaB
MTRILCIETATEVCSVALFHDETLLGIRESAEKNIHSAALTTFIDDLCKSSGVGFAGLDAIAVSMGPGSYTGLRIGVATAKGLCYALEKPLIAVPTLQAMADGMNYKLQITNYGSAGNIITHKSEIENRKSKILCCPMIDARRMEVYCEVFDHAGEVVQEVRAEIVDEFSFQEFLAENQVVFGGSGASKCRTSLGNHPNAIFMDEFQASARFMMNLAAERFRQNKFENLAYFEPFYLKDFIAAKPRVKGLN